MRIRISRLASVTILTTLALASVSAVAYAASVPIAAQLTPNIVAQPVNGVVDVNNTGHEAFWNQVTPLQIPLTSSNDYGGSTKTVTVKMANNGTHLLIFAQWSAPVSSRIGKTTIEQEAYPALFYANSTYSYDDRIVFWWSLSQTPGPPPCMQKACTSNPPGPGCIGSSGKGHGEGEALAGTGNLWHWKSARTDSLGASYGKLATGTGPNKGQPLLPSHSYADNEYINTTGHYQLGVDQYPTASVPGNFTVTYAENNIPYNTFVVYAHGVYDPSTHTYTWEASRALHTTPSLHMVQFGPNTTYYFAVAVWEGGPLPIPAAVPHPAGWTTYGENEETKSISTWNTMALGPSPFASTTGGATTVQSTVTTTTSVVSTTTVSQASTAIQVVQGGPDYQTAVAASLVAMIVGLLGGVIAVGRFGARKT